LEIVEDIANSNKLRELVGGSDSKTQESFRKLEAFLITEDYKMLLRLRNNLSFHYDGKLAVRALERILEKVPGDLSAMTLGTEPLHWHFQLADKVVNSIFAREVLRIGHDDDVRKESDKIIHRLFDLHVALADFSMHFIRYYFSR
jgi:hypothetical protein